MENESKTHPINWLLLVPFVALLWLPFYNSSETSLLGFPFFYAYMFVWVPITAFLIFIVYKVSK
jgi:hypothetical protein